MFHRKPSAYHTAFNYIAALNKNTPLVVIDTTVNLSIFSFFNELNETWHLKRQALVMKADSLDKAHNKHGNKIKGLENLGKPTINNGRVLYFSALMDTLLVAEIIPIKNHSIPSLGVQVDLSYRSQAFFNSSTKYLFVFDRNRRLKRVYQQKMLYN